MIEDIAAEKPWLYDGHVNTEWRKFSMQRLR